MARAFVPHGTVALLALSWALLAVLPGTLRGGLYLYATCTGMVLLQPINVALDLLIMLPLMLPVAGLTFAALIIVDSLNALPVVFILAVVLVIAALVGVLFLLPRRGASAVPTGPETPPGPRWELAGFAQLPGTRFTAVQTARRVLATVPPAGAVVVATANTPEQFEQYRRFGFTGGPHRRVHRIIT